jgi:hypothetical protein
MNFLDAIKEGLDKAEQAEQACKEVSDVFRQINEDLNTYNTGLSFRKGVSALGSATAALQKLNNAHKESEFLDADKLLLVLEDDQEKKTTCEVGGWRQSVKGYPCIIQYEGEEVFCFSAGELSTALKGLFSSASFGKKLKKLLSSPIQKDSP